MSGFDESQARYYIQLLRDDPNAKVHWQFFSDNGESKTNASFYETLDGAKRSILYYQSQGCGVYVTVNPKDGEGRESHHITGFKWLFADMDGAKLPDNLPLEPAFVTGRDIEHTHIYWPIADCLTQEQFYALQRRIAFHLGSDPQVIDPARVLRLPGSQHLKDKADPKKYTVMQDNQIDFEYTVDEVVEAFTLTDEQQQELDNWLENRESKNSGDGVTDDPIYIEQTKHFYANIAKPCMGQNTQRSRQLLTVAGYGYDKGLSEDVNYVLLKDYFNPRCNPPWSEAGLEAKKFRTYVRNAHRYLNNAPGCTTAAGVFANSGIVHDEPKEGWEAHYANPPGKKAEVIRLELKEDDQLEDVGNVDYTYACKLLSHDINDKSKTHIMAVAFVGRFYDDRKLLRQNKTFYAYNGKHWEEVEDETIIKQIETLYEKLELEPSKIEKVYKKVCNITHVEKELVRGTWLHNPEGHKNYNCIVQNGILIIDKDSMKLIPHTHHYFDLNILGFDYNPDSTCDEWLQLHNEQWDINTKTQQQMSRQLQECVGMIMMHDTSHHMMMMLVGKSRSGKGVVSKVLEGLLGQQNVSSPSLEGLEKDDKLLELTTTKLAIIPEANNISSANSRRVLDRLKMISGNDNITLSQKYKKAITCRRFAIIMMVANELPDFTDGSAAYANRIIPFQFIKSYAGREDRGLVDRLLKPDSMSGILNWAIEGYQRVMRNGYIFKADLSKEVIDEIEEDSFPLSRFFYECCDITEGVSIGVDQLYDYYKQYTRFRGVKFELSPRKFTKLISSSSLNIRKLRVRDDDGVRTQVFQGITINMGKFEKTKPVMATVHELKGEDNGSDSIQQTG